MTLESYILEHTYFIRICNQRFVNLETFLSLCTNIPTMNQKHK